MIDAKWAKEFAQEWIDSWNAHDIHRMQRLCAVARCGRVRFRPSGACPPLLCVGFSANRA